MGSNGRTEQLKVRWATSLVKNDVEIKKELLTKTEVDTQCSRLFESVNQPGAPVIFKMMGGPDWVNVLVIDDMDIYRYTCKKVRV